jgi:PDDEXK-like domain of unknown function (DUF3799)
VSGELTNCKVIGEGIPYDVYSRQLPNVGRGHPDFCLSRSELVAFFECPEKWLLREEENSDTPATKMGKLVETLETHPADFSKLFIVEPLSYENAKGKINKWTYKSAICRTWRDEQEAAGLCVISPKVLTQAEKAAEIAKAYEPRRELFACSKKQVMVVGTWKDGDIEIPLRCLIDLVPDVNSADWGKSLGDAKTARNGNPANWAHVVSDEAYDIQAALSLDLYTAATGEDRTDWVFPLSENQPPFHVVKPMPALTSEFLQWGRQKYKQMLAFYGLCLRTNVWPSYQAMGLQFRYVQFIGPDDLWEYRKTAGGIAAMSDYRPKPEPISESENVGITP